MSRKRSPLRLPSCHAPTEAETTYLAVVGMSVVWQLGMELGLLGSQLDLVEREGDGGSGEGGVGPQSA